MGLQVRDDGKQVAGLRVAFLAEHTHQAFGRRVGDFAKAFKADGGVYVVAQDGFACIDFARQKALYALSLIHI